MGFPLGGNLVQMLKRGLNTGDLKTTLKVRPTSVAGRIFNKDGSVKYIQIEGGVDHGNSGGAAVDTNGNVVAVVVAEAPGTNMKYVIPSEYVIHLLLGRVFKVIPGQAVGSLGSSHQPIVATIADPLNRLRKVDAEVFAGPKPDLKKGEKPIRAGGDRLPPPQPGDGPRTVAALEYDTNKQLRLGDAYSAQADLLLPGIKENEVYWFQPHYYAKDGTERWGEAIVMDMGRYPVEQKPAHLEIVHKTDSSAQGRAVEIESRQVFGYTVEELGSTGSDSGLQASLTERVASVEKNGDAKILIKYKDVHLEDKDRETMMRQAYKGAFESIKWLRTTVTVTKDGRFKAPVVDTADVPRDARPILQRFNQQIIDSLEVMALGLPGKDVQPGDTWGHQTAYTFDLEKNHQNASFQLTCKYVGTRVRDGREEAVIEIEGRAVRGNADRNSEGRPEPNSRGSARPDPSGGNDESFTDDEGKLKVGVYGSVHGAAVVDLATSCVTVGRTESELAVVFPLVLKNPENPGESTEMKVFAGLHLDVTLRRSLNGNPPKNVDVMGLLPNQPRVYNPLVGVGTPATIADTGPLSSTPERNTILAPDLFDKVKHSAVMIRVDRNDGGGEGSGWFAAPGIIVTNCHVVGMLEKANRPPEKITVYLDRDTDKQRILSGELMAVNRVDDLAVIRVKGDKLPEPFKITPQNSLVEADRLEILGFPRGSSLARQLGMGLGVRDLRTTLKARPTIVTGRILNSSDGSIKYVQFEGGADHGNSGGPVVDSKGDVRAVLVAGFDGYELRWGIPSEYADRMIQGYPLEVIPGRPHLDGSVAKQTVEIRFSDPVGRLSAVAVDYWEGNNGKPRKASDKLPKAVGGDGPRKTATLTLKPGERPGERLAVGEFVIPDMSPGRVCWLQPRFTNGTGKEQWSQAAPFVPDGPPVERKPTLLAVKYRSGTSRDVDLVADTRVHTRKIGHGKAEGIPLKVTLSENVRASTAKGALIQIVYQALELDIKKIIPGLEDVPPQVQSMLTTRLKPFLNLIRGVAMVVNVTKNGHMTLARNGLSYAKLPLGAQPQMHEFNNQIFTSLQALTFPLPGKEVPYGYTWDFPTDLFVVSRNRSDSAAFKMQFKYVGVRDRSGRAEAVIEITGSLVGSPKDKNKDTTDDIEEPTAPPAGAATPSTGQFDDKPPAAAPQKSKKGLYGVAHGIAYVDVNEGFISEVKLFIDLDMEVMQRDPETKRDLPVDAGGTMELHLTRRQASK